MLYLRYYSKRILNPFSGTAHIIELNNTRAVCTDGANWQMKLLKNHGANSDTINIGHLNDVRFPQ